MSGFPGMHVRDPERWFYKPGNGDGVFAEPFGLGRADPEDFVVPAAEALNPNFPVRGLRNDETYNDGFSFASWGLHEYGNVEFAVIFTDGEDAEGIREVINGADMVAFGTNRTVEKQIQAGVIGRRAGQLILPGNVAYQHEYRAQLMDAMAGFDCPVVDLDPERHVDGSLINPADQLLQGMEDATRLMALEHGVASKPFEAASLAHQNAEVWRMLGAFGAKSHAMLKEQPWLTAGALILPEEYSDILRRVPALDGPSDVFTAVQWNNVDLNSDRQRVARGIFEAGRITNLFEPRQ